MNVVVTLAAFNEERNIAPVIATIHELGYRVIVVDDGSSDRTAEVSREMGATVVRHLINMGQGMAVLTGFKMALLDPGCDVIIEMDADGQHRPEEIPLFVERMRETGADVVVGSRILGSHHHHVSPVRRFFLPYVTAVVNRVSGYELTDAMCGYRAFRREALVPVASILDSVLEPQYSAAEMFIRFGRAGLRIEEVPVQLADRTSGVSHKGMARYGAGIAKAILRTLVEHKQ